MPLYHAISSPRIGDGERTSFWTDEWLGGGPLDHRMPALFSHATTQHVCRGRAAQGSEGVPHTPPVGCRCPVAGRRSPDDQHCPPLLRPRHAHPHPLAPNAVAPWTWAPSTNSTSFVWDSFAPTKAKFFAWLLVQSRIQSRAALLKKTILTAAEATCPICGAASETATHIIFECPIARRFWGSVGGRAPLDADVDQRRHSLYLHHPLLLEPVRGNTPERCCFRCERPCPLRLLAMCRDDAKLWRARVPAVCRDTADLWDACLLAACVITLPTLLLYSLYLCCKQSGF
jgi:hypothetical protein